MKCIILSSLIPLLTGFGFFMLSCIYVPVNGIRSISVPLVSSFVKLLHGFCLLGSSRSPKGTLNSSWLLKLSGLLLLFDFILGVYLFVQVLVLTYFRNCRFLRNLLFLWIALFHFCSPTIPALLALRSRQSKKLAVWLLFMSLSLVILLVSYFVQEEMDRWTEESGLRHVSWKRIVVQGIGEQ
ncbi:hypothetical protein GpartN1_g5429.t1 [Galdieria partita]|uniref:Uncharacterized protein n=1 Tax=Galdieria partita TaxID=83374 RepID=A0A9C7PZG6_9RHOD|nr:hypothetical protein GpartN1_g5429.t1 [Galdieria partita]